MEILTALQRVLGTAAVKSVPGACWVARRLALDTTVRTTLSHGAVMYLDPCHPAQRGMISGEFEQDEKSLLMRLVQPGSIVIDIGAHIGFHTVPLAKAVDAAGHVFAFEPWSANRALLVQNLGANELSNVTVFATAVSDQVGRATFSVPTEYRTTMLGSLSNAYADGAADEIQVETTTIDAFVERHRIERLDVVKIDAEGAEMRILAGMDRTLRLLRPAVLCEITPSRTGQTMNSPEFTDWLSAVRYAAARLESGRLVPANGDAAGNYLLQPLETAELPQFGVVRGGLKHG